MDERLTDEQLQAIRERQEAVKATALKEHEARQALEQDSSAAEKHYALINAEFEWEDARRHAEAFADEDIEALLAHIDALEAVLSALTDDSGYVEVSSDDRSILGRQSCTYCYRSWEHGEPEHHDDDCPIARARALLSK